MAILKLVIMAAVCQFMAGQENVCSAFCTALGIMQSSPGRSCDKIYQINKQRREMSGDSSGSTLLLVHVQQVYCDMEWPS